MFTKLTGALAGLLLVAFGALSLMLSHTSLLSGPTRAQICQFWLCAPRDAGSPTDMNPPDDRTLAQAQADLVLNPASAYRWVDLADAELDKNNLAAGKFCLRQALAAAPGNPAILFRASNCYLRLEDYPETLRHLTAVLRNPALASYYDRVFTLYSQMDLAFEDLLDQGLPRTPLAANAFLQFWIGQGKLDEAQDTWTWINKNSLTSLPSAGSYVSLLAKESRWDEAIQSWSDYTEQLDGSYLKTNWVYNGSFEMNPVDCPFDWRLQPQPGLVVVRDSDVGYRGHSSLRLTYSETPKIQQAAAYQTVVLEPGKWQVKVAMKTRQVTSDQGVVIRVVDSADPSKLDVATTSLQGTEDWTVITKTFDVKAPARARVEIMRPPGRDFDSRLTGTVWIDSVELAPLESLKATGLTKAGDPCESHGDCGDGEVSLQTTAQDHSQQ